MVERLFAFAAAAVAAAATAHAVAVGVVVNRDDGMRVINAKSAP